MRMALSTAAAPRMLVRSTRLLAAVGGLAMATTGECSPLVLATFLLFFLIGMKIEAFPALVRFFGAAQPFFALVVFALAIADFFTASQSFLLAVAHFLLGIQALRLMALRTNRENLGSVLVSSLMVLSASTLAVDWTFFVMLLCFLPALVWTLMLHTIALESDLVTALAQSPLRGSSPVWRQMAPSLRRAASAAFGIAVVCCAFVFVIFPRFNFQGFRGQFLQPLRKTGFTSQVDLDASGRIYDDPAIVMRVEVPETDRAHWTGYIRGSVLEEFEDSFWRRSSRPQERIYPSGVGEFRLRAPGRGVWIRQSIYLESMDTPVLFAASHPFFVRIDRPFLEVSTDGTIQRRQSDAWRIHYDVTSAPTAGQEPFLSGTGLTNRALAAAEARSDTELPEMPLTRLAALSRDQGGGGTPAQIAERLAAYLRTHYTYTTLTPPAGGESPVEHFLFSTKRGHCEYFASALALMLRYRGIPARIVTGFLSREWNRRGGYYIVRMKHAHAWVEYFTPAAGWVEIDPSPREVDEGEGDAAWRRGLRETWDYFNLRWNRYILSYDLEKQVSIIRSVTVRTGRMSAGFEHFVSAGRRLFSMDAFSWHPRLRGRFRVPVVPLLMGILVFLMAALVRNFRRRSGGVWFYRPLMQLLQRAGARPAPGRTLRELVRDAGPRLGEGGPSAQALAEAYYRVRFAPGAALSRAESRALQVHLRKLRRAMLDRVTSKLTVLAVIGAALSFLPSPAHAAARFLALGDSYTAGTGVTEAQRWPHELVRLMRQQKVDIADPEVIARNGWTTSDLLAGIGKAKPKGPYDLVTLMIGVNNQFRGETIDAYRQDLRKLLAIATQLAGNDARHVIVLTIPDYSVMPYAKTLDTAKISKEIERFNLALGDEAHRVGAKIVDVTSVSRFAGKNPTLVADDGLHPSWRLHAVWARLVFPMAHPLVTKLR